MFTSSSTVKALRKPGPGTSTSKKPPKLLQCPRKEGDPLRSPDTAPRALWAETLRSLLSCRRGHGRGCPGQGATLPVIGHPEAHGWEDPTPGKPYMGDPQNLLLVQSCKGLFRAPPAGKAAWKGESCLWDLGHVQHGCPTPPRHCGGAVFQGLMGSPHGSSVDSAFCR